MGRYRSSLIDKQADFAALCQIVLDGRSFTSVEARRQAKDGSPIHVSTSIAPLRDASDNVTVLSPSSLTLLSATGRSCAPRERRALPKHFRRNTDRHAPFDLIIDCLK